MPIQNPNFADFLKKTFGQKEASMIIAADEEDRHAFQQQLERAGFRRLDRVMQKAATPSYVLLEDQKYFKEAYDFAVQLPLGQIQLWDRDQSKTVILAPDPKHPIVFLLTKETLASVQQAGMDILSKIGMTYQH